MTAPEPVRDAGLQPERTQLAWQRAALAFLGFGMAVPRLAWPVLGAWSVAPALLVIGIAVTLFVVGRRRYRSNLASLAARERPRFSGLLPLLAALATLVLAVVAAAIAVGRFFGAA